MAKVTLACILIMVVLNLDAIQPHGTVTEGVKLMRKQVGQVRLFAQDSVGCRSQSLLPLCVATGQASVLSTTVINQQNFWVLVVVTEDNAID